MQPVDERHHTPAACGRPSSSWSESWYFDFATEQGLGGYVHLAMHPVRQRAWYWACVVRPDQGPVIVRDHDVAPPRGAMLEIRADGLWAECVCETPLEHWSLGLEAFGLRLDDPLDALHGELGERLPVGHDLSWEATVDAIEPASAPCDGRGYVQAGRVEGEILLGRERVTVDGTGQRAHTWGPSDWRDGGWRWAGLTTSDGVALSATALADGRAFGARWAPGGSAVAVEHADVADDELTVDDLNFSVDVLGVAPLAFESASGDAGGLWRALCRFRGGESTGVGWTAHVVPTTEDG